MSNNHFRTHFVLMGILMLLVGCSSEPYRTVGSDTAEKSNGFSNSEAGSESELDIAGYGGRNRGPQEKSPTDNRKIIFTAGLTIVVEDFDPVESAIEKIVKQYGGFIADSKVNSRTRTRRTGSWTVRIPVAKFDAFLSQVGSIGITASRSRDAQDVTEEYVDVSARVENKKKLESRILELLDRPDDKLQHVIEVERELARVREEIERMEGRIRYLNDRVDLTTVSIEVQEEQAYQPPEELAFMGRVTRAWSGSLSNTKRGLENFAVWLAGHGLPLIISSAIVLLIYRLIRRKIKKKRRRAADQAANQAV